MLSSRPLILGTLPTAPSCARQVSRLQLAGWGLTALHDTVDVIVTELVTNAVQACDHRSAGAQVVFRLSVSGPRIRIEVWDADPRLPRTSDHVTEYGESGRGLHLVDALSAGHWGAAPSPNGGKVVCAELPLPRG